MFIAGWN